MRIQNLSGGRAIASVMLLTVAQTMPARSQPLHAFVEAAASRNPEISTLKGRRDAIGARQQAADALTPGAPTLSGSYMTDQLIRNRNQREAQIGVSTPIWLPGEGTASRGMADAELTRSQARANAQMLRVAGQVRDALADFALARAEVSVSERRLRETRALEADVSRRAQSREAAEADLLLARAERLSADGDLRGQRSVLEQSKLEFQSLTGLLPPAAIALETLPPELGVVHPSLEDAKGAIAVAHANQRLVGIQNRDSPEIGVVVRRNRDIGGNVYDNSIGVELRIPFATEARNTPKRMAAQADLLEASAGYAATEREIVTEQRKARVNYDNALATRDLSRERAVTLARQSALVGRGYQGGQLSLLDNLRARSLAFDAEAAKARADIGVQRAIGRLNQAFGIVP